MINLITSATNSPNFIGSLVGGLCVVVVCIVVLVLIIVKKKS